MYRIIWLFFTIFFCTSSYASVDIKLACDEKKEQKKSLLTKMSTSYMEAHLAGQCTGYKSYSIIDWEESCSEYIEQKKSLLSSLSTSLIEANLAGICVGAIYRVAERKCGRKLQNIDYFNIAEGRPFSSNSVKVKIDCRRG
jgi:hypothetical protein